MLVELNQLVGLAYAGLGVEGQLGGYLGGNTAGHQLGDLAAHGHSKAIYGMRFSPAVVRGLDRREFLIDQCLVARQIESLED